MWAKVVAGQPALLAPSGHWSVDALAWLAARGVAAPTPPWSPSTWLEVQQRLVAAESAAHRSNDVARLVRAWRQRFDDEFGTGRDGFAGTASVGAGLEERVGVVAPQNSFAGQSLPTPLPDRHRALATTRLALGSEQGFLRAEGEWQERVTLAQLEAGVRWRIWRVAAGRMPVGYGPRTGEGIIFGGRVAVDQIAVQSVAPVRLPVGLAWGHMFLGRFRRSQNPRRPYVWGGAIAWQPHPRLQVSILRGAMFAGDSAAKPFSWRQFARVVIPVKNTNEENHVYSFATWYRPPIERWWPLVVALEWGADDSAGALDERPGVRLQLYAPLPSGGGAGLMWSRLGTRPGLGFTGHGPWYHHGVELGPWIAEAQALGLALGGELSEVQGYAHGTAAAGRASWALSLGARRRSVDNLYAPLRIGRANVGALNLSWRPTGRFEVQATGSLERGKRWTSREFRLATLWRLW
jgi:hypothetical protein